MRETLVQSLGHEDTLEKEMATHSSTLAWKIPWTEKPGRLQSMGLQRAGHDWVTSLSLFYWPGIVHLPVSLSLCLFILFMWFSRKEYRSGLPFPSPVDHIFSELSTINHSSWVTLHSMTHSFIELDKTVIHVISLISFLWLWFSFCLPSDG